MTKMSEDIVEEIKEEMKPSRKEFDPSTCKHKYWKWKWENSKWTDYRVCNVCGKVEKCVSKLR